MTFRRIGSAIFCLGLIFFLFPAYLSITQAADTGCCEKTEKNDVTKKSYITLTEEECLAVPGQTNDFFTVHYTPNAIALNNAKCLPVTPPQIRETGDPIYFYPAVSIPGSKFVPGEKIKIEESTLTFANYIIAIFKYATGIIGIIAAIVLMIAGITWLTAGGNNEQIKSAKQMIGSSLIGLTLTFGSFVLLSTVNTNLVNLKITSVTNISKTDVSNMGCCKKYTNNPLEKQYTTEQTTKLQCDNLKKEVGKNENQYKDIQFIGYAKSSNNECVPAGCCTFTVLSEIKQKIMYEDECKDAQSSGGLGNGFFVMTPEEIANKGIGNACATEADLPPDEN